MRSSCTSSMEIFQPISLGNVKIPNRIVFPAMMLNLASPNGKPTNLYLRVYIKPARGGAGLVFGGSGYPHVSGRSSPYMLALDRDEIVPELSKVANAISRYGSVPAIQILHAGRYTSKILTEGRGPVAPSPIPPPILFREVPRELTVREIEDLVEAYGRAAERCVKAGFKIVEVHAGMGYLPSLFLSRRTNRRKDDYGGSLENRARFLLEVVEECIRRCRSPIMVRYSLVDFLEDSISLEENLKVLKWLEDLGLACVNTVFGWHESRVPLTTRNVPPAAFAKYAGILKKNLGIPVAYGTRVKNLDIAEQIIKNNLADMVCLGRPLLAEPEAPSRRLKNLPVRPCIACNRCLSRVFSGKIVSCTVNPRLLVDERLMEGKGEVLVVGGGPSGLEAALTLSRRGFYVELWEGEEDLGGMLKYASLTPHGVEFGELIEYYLNSLERLNVTVKLGLKVDVEGKLLMLSEKYDWVLLALGPELDTSWVLGETSQLRPWYEAFKTSNVMGDAVVLGGNQVGLGISGYLASRGCKVYVLDVRKLGVGVEKAARWPLINELRKLGVELYAESEYVKVEGARVTFKHRAIGEKTIEAEHVFAAGRFRARIGLVELCRKYENISIIGNALNAPSNHMLYQAIYSSHNISSRILR